jgi:hypothetical protein
MGGGGTHLCFENSSYFCFFSQKFWFFLELDSIRHKDSGEVHLSKFLNGILNYLSIVELFMENLSKKISGKTKFN